MSAGMAKSGHSLHPATCRSDEPELRGSWLHVAVMGKRFVNMNIRVRLYRVRGPKSRHARMQPLTRGPEDDETKTMTVARPHHVCTCHCQSGGSTVQGFARSADSAKIGVLSLFSKKS